MVDGELSADHIQIRSTLHLVLLTFMSLQDDSCLNISLKVMSGAHYFLHSCDLCVLSFIFSHHLFSFTPAVSTKLNHSSLICFLSLLLAQFVPTFLFFIPFLFVIHCSNFGLNFPISLFDSDFFFFILFILHPFSFSSQLAIVCYYPIIQ